MRPTARHTSDATDRFQRRLRAVRLTERGFTLLELFVIMAMVAILCTIALGLTPGVVRSFKGSAGGAQVETFLRLAREAAVSRRRSVAITFPNTNTMVATTVAVGTEGAVVLQRVTLEGNLTFRTFSGQGDTPDAFGNGSALNFGGTAPWQFTSEGTFVDTAGNPINASIFIGQLNFPNTAAAATIFGPTARLNSWKWNGSSWQD